MTSTSKRKTSRGRQATLGGTVLAVLLALALQWFDGAENPEAHAKLDAGRTAAQPGAATPDADARIEAAVRDKRSGFMITVDAEVLKLLPDDEEGSRHQRFLVELASGRTLLVAHNIDLAPRVPASRGEQLRIHGQYEWNDRGGVLHWTHDDPDGDHEGGWIERGSKRYR